MKQIIIYLVCLVVISSYCIAMPISYYRSGDNGSSLHPFQIRNYSDLEALMSSSDDWGAYFILTADIDCSLISSSNPIGNRTDKFYGSFDGQNHTLSNLTLNMSGNDYIGLFGYAYSATISNLNVINVNIIGDNKVGGLIGYNKESIISNCNASGTIAVVRHASNSVGGFAGYSYNCNYYNCYSQVNISSAFAGIKEGYGGFVGYSEEDSFIYCKSLGDLNIVGAMGGYSNHGGFVGYASSSTFSRAYSSGSLSISNEDNIGGFAGYEEYSEISNCYSQSSITGSLLNYVGGFVGYIVDGSISFCYSAAIIPGPGEYISGGFSGYEDSPALYNCCYWDINLSGYGVNDGVGAGSRYTSPGMYGYTTSQMIALSTYTGVCSWDFANIWIGHDRTNYPTLMMPNIIATPTLTEWSRYTLIFSVLLIGCYFVYRKIYA